MTLLPPITCGEWRTRVNGCHRSSTMIFNWLNTLAVGPTIALAARMRTVGVLVTFVAISLHPAVAQEVEAPEGAIITSAHVSGLDLDRLSPGLQADIAALAGKPLNREQLRELAARIEAEHPWVVAAVRAVQHPDRDVRVVFVVARAREKDLDPNVNARYTVERVDIRGVPESDISQALRDELQALVGKLLDGSEVALEDRLRAELPDYDVRRRVVRGARRGQVQLLFVMGRKESTRWLRYEPLKSKFVYHSDQGWGGYVDFPIGSRDVRVTPSIAIDNRDDLIEEYSGVGIRVETRKIGTERLGASFEWSTFSQTWDDATLAAVAQDPQPPQLYEDRSTATPLVTFALTRQLRVGGGVSITELEPLSGGPESQMANAFVASIGYDQEWSPASGGSHKVLATFTRREGSTKLESDLVYTRYFAHAGYRYRWARHNVQLWASGGGISGEAPLFERFSLGDSLTLRGWNKYDIAPTGGDRMYHASVEYQYRGLALFLDSGSVWDAGSKAQARFAAGVGIHAGPVFFTLGFPLNTDELSPVFTMGLRVSGGVGILIH
jgi:Omp85 superfamily domain